MRVGERPGELVVCYQVRTPGMATAAGLGLLQQVALAGELCNTGLQVHGPTGAPAIPQVDGQAEVGIEILSLRLCNMYRSGAVAGFATH